MSPRFEESFVHLARLSITCVISPPWRSVCVAYSIVLYCAVLYTVISCTLEIAYTVIRYNVIYMLRYCARYYVPIMVGHTERQQVKTCYQTVSQCVCVFSSHIFWTPTSSGVCGHTSPGHTGGMLHSSFPPPPSFCCACLYFYRERGLIIIPPCRYLHRRCFVMK